MGKVVRLKVKKERKSVVLDGKTYVYLSEFAERVGIEKNTVYQWRYEGRLSSFTKSYLGKLVFEEKAIEPFKRTLICSTKVTAYR